MLQMNWIQKLETKKNWAILTMKSRKIQSWNNRRSTITKPGHLILYIVYYDILITEKGFGRRSRSRMGHAAYLSCAKIQVGFAGFMSQLKSTNFSSYFFWSFSSLFSFIMPYNLSRRKIKKQVEDNIVEQWRYGRDRQAIVIG